jgi:hypothetical protein
MAVLNAVAAGWSRDAACVAAAFVVAALAFASVADALVAFWLVPVVGVVPEVDEFVDVPAMEDSVWFMEIS